MPDTIQPENPAGASRSRGRRRFHLGALRFSVAQFLFALILLLVISPFVERMEYGKIIDTTLVTVVLVSAVLAVGGSRRTLIWALVLVIPAVWGRWASDTWSERIFPEAGLIPTLVFFLFLVFHLLRFILRAPRVNGEVLCAGIATYLMLAVLWGFAYMLANRLAPEAFAFTVDMPPGRPMRGFNSMYFSFITLTTVGYGDIVPLSPGARMLAMTEAVVGTFYMTMLIARLVALYSSEVVRKGRETPNNPDNSP